MYRTPAAEALIDHLETQVAMYEARVAKAEKNNADRFEVGLYKGYLDATNIYLEYAKGHLERIESEAELLPAPDAEQWLEQSMAGDWRDFPAA